MDPTIYLVPGYTTQGSSLARSAIYGRFEDIDEASPLGVSVKVFGYATEYPESAIKVIEDIALLALNFIGSFFSDGCKENLKERIFENLGRDSWDLAKKTFVVTCCILKPLITLGVLYYYGYQAYHNNQTIKELKFEEVDKFEKLSSALPCYEMI